MRPISTVVRTIVGGVALATALSAPARAQDTDAGLGVLSQLVGEWDGEAWMLRPEGRVTVRQQEWVWREAGGTILAVRGLGTMTTAAQVDTVHHAFAVIHRTHDRSGILMRAFTAEGHWLDPEIELTDQGYTWRMTDPRAGQIRYEMVIDEQGRWVENGYLSRDDGETWMHFMGMVLNKT